MDPFRIKFYDFHKLKVQKIHIELQSAEHLSPQLYAKRHYVILAKALDGIWLVAHACAVLCCGTRRLTAAITVAKHFELDKRIV